jgi:hypothetical protein
MSPTIQAFVQKWKGSAGGERANKDAFLLDLCEALEIAPPGPKDQSPGYCFEKDLKITHLDGSTSTGSIDLHKDGCFVLEAKQGSKKGTSGAKEGSAPIRGTRAYDQYMEKAFGQAVNYAIRLPLRPLLGAVATRQKAPSGQRPDCLASPKLGPLCLRTYLAKTRGQPTARPPGSLTVELPSKRPPPAWWRWRAGPR